MSEFSNVLLMITLDLLMIATTLWIFRRAGMSPRLRLGLAVGALSWLAVLHGILSRHWLLPTDLSGPAFLGLVFAVVGVVGALGSIPALRQGLAGLDQRALLLPQGIRVYFGAGFLAQAVFGQLPQGFGVADGFTHISAGFLGLLAAALWSQDGESSSARRMAWIANGFGLLDILVVASTLALVLLPQLTPFHPMMYAVFLPAPVWLWLHVVSIGKLLRDR